MMETKYQVIFKDGTLIGRPYKSKQRARNRVDSLDNQYGAYAHHIRPVEVLTRFDSSRGHMVPTAEYLRTIGRIS